LTGRTARRSACLAGSRSAETGSSSLQDRNPGLEASVKPGTAQKVCQRPARTTLQLDELAARRDREGPHAAAEHHRLPVEDVSDWSRARTGTRPRRRHPKPRVTLKIVSKPGLRRPPSSRAISV
jgi:hypothetical protein